MALAFTFRNIRLAGMAVVSVGIIANLVPIVLNGATPVRPEALVEAGMVDAADIERDLVRPLRVERCRHLACLVG